MIEAYARDIEERKIISQRTRPGKKLALIMQAINLGMALIAAFVVFAGVKGVGMATAALAYFQKQWLLGTNLVAGATSMVAKMGNAFTAFKAAPGYINGIGAALTALGLTPGGMVLTAIAGLVVVAQTLDDTFEKARKGLVNFNTELKSVDTDKLKKVVDSAGGIIKK